MQTNNKMAVAPVGKLIWQMSIPPLISMFLQYSYNLIDSTVEREFNLLSLLIMKPYFRAFTSNGEIDQFNMID